MGDGPAPRQLETLRLDWPIGLHDVGMSLGSASGLDAEHLVFWRWSNASSQR